MALNTDHPVIKCMYSCNLCGLKKVAVDVLARGEESVTEWMEKTFIVAVAEDHRSRSPRCMAREISEVMIPMTGADRIGGPAVQ